MKGKKGKSPRRQLAERLYKDPKSATFTNKTQSLIKAGYSEKVADRDGWELLGNVNFTDAEYDKIRPFLAHLPLICSNLDKVLQQIAGTESISAKMYNNLLKHFEQISKVAGWSKQIIEKKVAVVNINVPQQKCPECGTIMDYMKEGEE